MIFVIVILGDINVFLPKFVNKFRFFLYDIENIF